MKRPDLSVVIPLWNESSNLAALHLRLRRTLDRLAESHELVLVNDGSTDETPERLDAFSEADPTITVLHLSRNFGHQAALSAGLDFARGDAVIVLDGDLQDPPELIPRLLARWREGFEVVHAVRRSRPERWPIRLAYNAFYRLYRVVSEQEVPLDCGDCCLMDRRVVRALRVMPERQRFVRGLRSFVGFRQTSLAYDRDPRASGRSKYTLAKLVRLAVDGLVGFSTLPLRLVTYVGFLAAIAAIVLSGWVFADVLAHHTAPRGWASTLIVMLFLGATQLMGLGILGEYLGRVFLEVKGRPTYVLARKVRGGRRVSLRARRAIDRARKVAKQRPRAA
jgi:dolichol-phosphate mannosyltransferase